MASSPDTAKTALKARERVTLTRGIRGVPEGTHGVVKVANGLTWARYWVQFDNGEWVGSVDAAKVVPRGEWATYKVRRAEEAVRRAAEAERAADAPPADEAAAGGGDDGGEALSGPASRIPAHIVERSRAARARFAGG